MNSETSNQQANEDQCWEEARQILAVVESRSDEELLEPVMAASERAYVLLRDLILTDPVHLLNQIDRRQFLEISRLRAVWAARDWRDFFERNKIKPHRPIHAPEAAPQERKMRNNGNLTVCLFPEDRLLLNKIRRQIEDGGGFRRVADSEVIRIGVRNLPSETGEVVELYRKAKADDRQNRKSHRIA